MSDLWIVGIVAVSFVFFPFVVLLTSKLVGYGWEAGRHKFQKRRGNDGSGS